MSQVVDQIISTNPRFHAGGATNWNALPEILHALDALTGPEVSSVETGCGASTVIFAAGGGPHTTISPDAREHELVKKYCERNGVDHSNVTFVRDTSDAVLPGRFEAQSLDVVFIDGAHGFPYAIVDWHYLSQSLRVGGSMVVDDVAIPAISPLFHFMKAEKWWQLTALPDLRAAHFTLVEQPPPEDYRLQRFNRRMNYSFTPAPVRARLATAAAVGSARRTAAQRLPWLRDAWHRLR